MAAIVENCGSYFICSLSQCAPRSSVCTDGIHDSKSDYNVICKLLKEIALSISLTPHTHARTQTQASQIRRHVCICNNSALNGLFARAFKTLKRAQQTRQIIWRFTFPTTFARVQSLVDLNVYAQRGAECKIESRARDARVSLRKQLNCTYHIKKRVAVQLGVLHNSARYFCLKRLCNNIADCMIYCGLNYVYYK